MRLKAIADYPGALLVSGGLALLHSAQLAVIGSRSHSSVWRPLGKLFSETLAQKGITITSGLALGIDGVAHRGALAAEGKTIAVLGNGLSQVYPRRHATLARQIIDNGGTLVSEFPLITPPLPAHFPGRNRIISGLGVLVIEAALRSGSLVTVRCALEQGRDVRPWPDRQSGIGRPALVN